MLRRERRPGDLVFAVAFLAFSLFLLASIPGESKWFDGGKWFAQPRLWPAVSVGGMALFALMHLAGSLASPRTPDRWQEVAFWLRSLEYVPYFLLYVVAVPLLGYLPSTVVFSAALSWRVGFRDRRTLLCVAAFGLGVAVVFRGLLQVKIPAGAVYEHLPGAVRTFALTYL